MESKPQYKTADKAERKPWRCSGCGEVLGYIERKNSGAAYLFRHGDRLYYAEVYCQECGAAQLWMPDQASFEALLRTFWVRGSRKIVYNCSN